ncbi:outer membrane lipoprotein carrier protein LolA [Aquibium carbonis]|uniref:Outer membrane lipoprotein carrier protein LolA n=1 Tax=Aquibium carbonis TaxID=2495581 RepID=A0A429Z3Q7_9HYPH|nr:outer membrane lipoprotein carrier protein LolA [Aquibium carbonis]RST88361.1 outer membrane lipoprotein carrier protein LolA [Aquibium carbonis]
MTASTAPRPGRVRRAAAAFAIAAAAALTILPPTQASAQGADPQRIADHFAGVRTMTGEFVQFGPKGEQTGGKFFIERPGKIRFNYEEPSDFRVIADGQSVVINNGRLNTWDLYPLSKTPLKLLLDTRIDLSGNKVRSVRQDEDLTTIQLQDKSIFGDSTITMMFDPKSYELRQWTITDAKGKDTTVMIYNVQEGVAFDPSVFTIDYARITEASQGQGANRGK